MKAADTAEKYYLSGKCFKESLKRCVCVFEPLSPFTVVRFTAVIADFVLNPHDPSDFSLRRCVFHAGSAPYQLQSVSSGKGQ